MSVKLIVAMCKNNGIGNKNKIPWRISEDMHYFSKKTSGNHHEVMNKKNAVIMGRNTWESLPIKYKPLPNRYNIVLTKNAISRQHISSLDKDVVFLSSIDDAMILCYERCEKGEKGEKVYNKEKSNIYSFNNIWIIGGSSIYQEFMIRDARENLKISKYYITYIDKHYDCDTYFPLLENMNKYHLTRFEKYKCVDNNTPDKTPLNIYFIVFKKIEYIDEITIEQLFTSYKSKNERKDKLTLYIGDIDKGKGKGKGKVNMNNIDDFEILFSMFCS